MEIVARFVLSQLGFDSLKPSCEVLHHLSNKRLDRVGYFALSLFLVVATVGAVVPAECDEALVEAEDNCVFKVTTCNGTFKLLASREDGRDWVQPWKVYVVA